MQHTNDFEHRACQVITELYTVLAQALEWHMVHRIFRSAVV